MDSANPLAEKPLGALLFRLAIPTTLAQIVNGLYNVVDRMYIGRIPGQGTEALTGVGICFPIIQLITSFASLLGVGGAPLASIALGANDRERAQHVLGQCLSMLCVGGVFLSVFFFAAGPSLLRAFGASERTLAHALPYMRCYVLGSVFVMVTLGLNAFITAQGYTKESMITVVIGAGVNVVLDAVFIVRWGMGTTGAALATVIAQGVSCAWVLRFFMGKKTRLRIRMPALRLSPVLCGSIVALGLSQFVMQSTDSLVQVVLNRGLLRHGGDVAVGAMTVITSYTQILMMPMWGLSQAAQPILSYNFGAGNPKRVRDTFLLLLKVCLGYMTAVWLFIQCAPQVGVYLFSGGADQALTEMACWGMRLFMGTIFAMGAQNAVQQTFVSVGMAKSAIFIALLRKVFLLIPLALVLPAFLGLTGIFLSEPFADAISATTAVSLLFYQRRKIWGAAGNKARA